MRRGTPAALLAACVAGLGLGAPTAGAYTQISMPLGFNPTAVAVSPLGDTAIPVGGVVIGRVATPSLVAGTPYVANALTLGFAGIAYRPDGGEAYAISSTNDALIIVDTTTGQPSTVNLGNGCTSLTGVAANAAGTHLYVACDIADSGADKGILLSIRTSDLAIAAPIGLPFDPRAVVLSPDGSRAYVTAASESKLAIVTLPGGGVTVPTLPGVSQDLTVNAAGSYLYVPMQTGAGTYAVARVLVNGFSTTDTVPLPVNADPGGVALDPDTGRLYVALRGGGGIAVVDTISMELVTTIPSSALAVYDVALDPDGMYAYAVRGSGGTAGIARIQLRPDAPTDLRATAGDGSATIAFTPGSDNQSAIQTYQYSIDDGATWATPNPLRASSPVTIGELTNGITYAIRLRAINGQSPGQPSAAVSVTPTVAAPAAPTTPARDTGTPATAALRTSTPKVRGNAITTTFTASGPGTATQTGTVVTAARAGRAQAVRACSTATRVKRASTVTLTCRLTRQARALRRKGALRVRLVTAFTPTGGAKAEGTRTVALARTR